MKSLCSAAFAVLFLVFGSTAQAACINGAPNGGTLEIYSKPVVNGPVIGGVGIGECNVEVTEHCKPNGYCQVFLGTLSGWADMRYISVDADERPPKNFVYTVADGSGTVTMGGISQPAPVEQRGKLIFTPDGEAMMLTLPREFASPPVRMQRTGSSSFTGMMTNWGGFPMKVEVIAERISDPRATLEFYADNHMVKMDLKLVLKRANRSNLTTKLPRNGGRAIGQPGTQTIKKPGSGVPIVPTQRPAQGHIDIQNQSDASLCVPLSKAIGPILRGRKGASKRVGLMKILRQLGVYDVAGATEFECFNVAVELVATGILSDRDIDVSQSPYDGLGGPDPDFYQGEDPNTMIRGGVEGLSQEQSGVQVRPTSASSSLSSVPSACIRLADQIVQIVADNRKGAVRKLQTKLVSTNLDTISSKSERHCLFASEELQREGLVR